MTKQGYCITKKIDLHVYAGGPASFLTSIHTRHPDTLTLFRHQCTYLAPTTIDDTLCDCLPLLCSFSASTHTAYFPRTPPSTLSTHPSPPGHTTFSLNSSGLVQQHAETWSISAAQALTQTFTPGPAPTAAAAMGQVV